MIPIGAAASVVAPTPIIRIPDMTHPAYLSWQVDWPLFVKIPFNAAGKQWKKGDHFDWLVLKIEEPAVAQLYATGRLYHNKELEKQTNVGDKLEMLDSKQLKLLVEGLNAEVKLRTNSAAEFKSKRCKQSAYDNKQRGLIRSFLRNNLWIEDKFFEVRDGILEK